jgi:hypothetical protein
MIACDGDENVTSVARSVAGSRTRFSLTSSGSRRPPAVTGVTSTIDQHHKVTSTMGERFVMVRLRAADPVEQATRAIGNVGSEREMRRQLTEAAKSILVGVGVVEVLLDDGDRQVLVRLAALAATARSAVDRDSRSREIEAVPAPEAPGRIVKQLTRMVMGLRVIGVDRHRSLRISARLALDSPPAARRAVIEQLGTSVTPQATKQIADAIRHPPQTTRRALEELNAHQVVEKSSGGAGGADEWMLADWAVDAMSVIDGIPEKSEERIASGVPAVSEEDQTIGTFQQTGLVSESAVRCRVLV